MIWSFTRLLLNLLEEPSMPIDPILGGLRKPTPIPVRAVNPCERLPGWASPIRSRMTLGASGKAHYPPSPPDPVRTNAEASLRDRSSRRGINRLTSKSNSFRVSLRVKRLRDAQRELHAREVSLAVHARFLRDHPPIR